MVVMISVVVALFVLVDAPCFDLLLLLSTVLVVVFLMVVDLTDVNRLLKVSQSLQSLLTFIQNCVMFFFLKVNFNLLKKRYGAFPWNEFIGCFCAAMILN